MADLLGFGGGGPAEALSPPRVLSARQGPPAAQEAARLVPEDIKGISFPAPLPWLQPAQPAEGGDGRFLSKGAALPRPLALGPLHERDAPPVAGAAGLDLEARLVACELRGAARDKQGELLERLSTALQEEVQDQKARLLQLREGQGQLADRMSSNLQELAQEQKAQLGQLQGSQDARSLAAEARLGELEQRAQRAEAAAQEQARRLQADIRELAMQALGRQRTELEEELTRALTRQSASLDEVHSATKARSSQLQSDVDRLSSSTEELGAQLLALQTELRSRMAQLEASRLGGGWGQPLAAGGASPGAPVPGLDAAAVAVEHLRHQLNELRTGASQADASLVELRGRLESEAARAAAAQRDHEARLASLGHALQAERRDLHQAIAQRVEVLEGRLGVERSDLLAQQSDLREELLSGDQDAGARMRDMGAQLRAELDTAERRVRAEVLGLRDYLDSQLMQAQSKRAGDDEALRASAAALARRLDGSAELSAEALKGLKREVDVGLQDVREALRAEAAQRAEAERRWAAELREALAAAGAQVAGLSGALEKQAAAVAAELERTRRAGAERADSLSRYVDEAVAAHAAGAGGSSAAAAGQAAAEPPRLAAALEQLQAELREQGQHFEKRLQVLDEEQRRRLRRTEEAAEREAGTTRKEAERNVAAAERRTAAAQEELKARFEAYARNFDAAISSVQAAVLRAPRPEASAPAARASASAGAEAARRPDRRPDRSRRSLSPAAEARQDLPPARPMLLPPEAPPWASRPPEAEQRPRVGIGPVRAARSAEAPRSPAEENETMLLPTAAWADRQHGRIAESLVAGLVAEGVSGQAEEPDDDWGETRGGSQDASASGVPGPPPAMSGIQLEALSSLLPQ